MPGTGPSHQDTRCKKGWLHRGQLRRQRPRAQRSSSGRRPAQPSCHRGRCVLAVVLQPPELNSGKNSQLGIPNWGIADWISQLGIPRRAKTAKTHCLKYLGICFQPTGREQWVVNLRGRKAFVAFVDTIVPAEPIPHCSHL